MQLELGVLEPKRVGEIKGERQLLVIELENFVDFAFQRLEKVDYDVWLGTYEVLVLLEEISDLYKNWIRNRRRLDWRWFLQQSLPRCVWKGCRSG